MNKNIFSLRERDKFRDRIRPILREYSASKTPGLYKEAVEQLEYELFSIALLEARGSQSKATEILGMNRGTFRSKLKKLGILR